MKRLALAFLVSSSAIADSMNQDYAFNGTPTWNFVMSENGIASHYILEVSGLRQSFCDYPEVCADSDLYLPPANVSEIKIHARDAKGQEWHAVWEKVKP